MYQITSYKTSSDWLALRLQIITRYIQTHVNKLVFMVFLHGIIVPSPPVIPQKTGKDAEDWSPFQT